MKKLVFASVVAITSICLVSGLTLRAQDITIKDPTEYNAYTNASGQSDPRAKAAALESFLQTYPQSVVKKTLLNTLIDTYQASNDPDHVVSAADRLLQVDPGNMKAIWARSLGTDSRVIGLSWARTPNQILTLPSSGIRSVADLKGRRLAIVSHSKALIDMGRASALRTGGHGARSRPRGSPAATPRPPGRPFGRGPERSARPLCRPHRGRASEPVNELPLG